MLLTDLPAELLVQTLVQLNNAADFARAAKSCSKCNDAMEVAVGLCALKRGLLIAGPRPWLQLSPWLQLRAAWPFLLRAAEVRQQVLAGLEENRTREQFQWLRNAERNGDAPTKWCIINEMRSATTRRMEAQKLAEAVAAAEQAARIAAERAARAVLRRQQKRDIAALRRQQK